jgi:hypothetical protein
LDPPVATLPGPHELKDGDSLGYYAVVDGFPDAVAVLIVDILLGNLWELPGFVESHCITVVSAAEARGSTMSWIRPGWAFEGDVVWVLSAELGRRILI